MPLDMSMETLALENVLSKRELTMFRVKKRGQALIIVSGDPEDPEPHARLTYVAGGRWRLDVQLHTGRWEQTGFVGDLGELVDTLQGIGRLDPRDA